MSAQWRRLLSSKQTNNEILKAIVELSKAIRLEISSSSLRTSRTVIASIADAVALQEINPLVAMEAKEVELDDNRELSSKVQRDYYKGIFTVAFQLQFNLSRH